MVNEAGWIDAISPILLIFPKKGLERTGEETKIKDLVWKIR